MIRKCIFQLHWLLGITVGIVLAIMGVTGALLSFEDEIVAALSPSRVTVPTQAVPLLPKQLVARVAAQRPGAAIGQLRLSSDPGDAAQVRLQLQRPHKDERGVTYVNPYTGAILGQSAGGSVFSFVEQLHRFLGLPPAPGDKSSSIGRNITGIAALSLVFFALSGLYLRWPREPLQWRSWFALDLKRTGRNLYHELHVVLGTWVLVVYLLAALTGLTWSYDWYRRIVGQTLGVAEDVKGPFDDHGARLREQAGTTRPRPIEASPGVPTTKTLPPPATTPTVAAGPEPSEPQRSPAPGHDADGKRERKDGWDGQIGPPGGDGDKKDERKDLPPDDLEAASGQREQSTGPDNGAARLLPAGYQPGDRQAARMSLASIASLPRASSTRSSDDAAKLEADIPGRDPGGAIAPSLPIASLDGMWLQFLEQAGPDYGKAGISIPRDGGPVRIERVVQGGFHDGIMDRYYFDGRTGALTRTDLARDRPIGHTITGSMLAFHSGAFLGLPGRIAMMIAGLLMPIFLITGLLLYLHRRARKRQLGQFESNALIGPDTPSDLLIVHASQAGTALLLARKTAVAFANAGKPVRLLSASVIEAGDLEAARTALFVASTYEDGAPPDDARRFASRLMGAPHLLDRLSYAVLALGDREYPHFCRFGRELDSWLFTCGARRLFAPIELDGDDTAGEAQWAERLVALGAASGMATWEHEPFTPWLLARREHINQGSPGGPVYLLRLAPKGGQLPAWQAGDIVEIRPRNDPAAVETLLAALRQDGDRSIDRCSLREHLASMVLPATIPRDGTSVEKLVERLRPLPTREYSIASIPADGSLDLVVRQVVKPNGLGLGSGWLTEHLPLTGDVALRIRDNPNFHRLDDLPMILVGNGTGIAGLRAHLRNSARSGHSGHWLLFGERDAQHDCFFREEIEGWLRDGTLARFDVAWSRNPDPAYVQHLVSRNAHLIQTWVAAGAAVLVCGSLEGMAPGVDTALRKAIGSKALDALAVEGRYRRDVY